MKSFFVAVSILIFISFACPNIFADNLPETQDTQILQLIEELSDSDIIANYYTGRKLLKIGKPAVSHLIKALNHDKSRIRFASIILLEQLKDTSASSELVKVFQDNKKSDRERAAASIALGRLGAKEYSKILVEGLNEKSNTVKNACAASLGVLKEGEAIPPLLKILAENKESESGKVTMRIIKMIGDNGIPQLEEILKEGKFDEQMLAIEVLGEIGSKNSKNLLTNILKNENKYLSISSAYVLSVAGESNGKETAEKHLKDSDLKIRMLAIKTLENISKNFQ